MLQYYTYTCLAATRKPPFSIFTPRLSFCSVSLTAPACLHILLSTDIGMMYINMSLYQYELLSMSFSLVLVYIIPALVCAFTSQPDDDLSTLIDNIQ